MKQAYILFSFGNVKFRFAPFFISLTRLNIKNVMKKFLFWFAVAKRRQAETHLIILDSVQKKLEFQPKGTANLQIQPFQPRSQARRPHRRCVKLPKTLKL